MFLKFFEHQLTSLVNETCFQILTYDLTWLLGLVAGEGLIDNFFLIDFFFLGHLERVSVIRLLGFFLESGRLVAMIH
jgi:hypothetical protein